MEYKPLIRSRRIKNIKGKVGWACKKTVRNCQGVEKEKLLFKKGG